MFSLSRFCKTASEPSADGQKQKKERSWTRCRRPRLETFIFNWGVGTKGRGQMPVTLPSCPPSPALCQAPLPLHGARRPRYEETAPGRPRAAEVRACCGHTEARAVIKQRRAERHQGRCPAGLGSPGHPRAGDSHPCQLWAALICSSLIHVASEQPVRGAAAPFWSFRGGTSQSPVTKRRWWCPSSEPGSGL